MPRLALRVILQWLKSGDESWIREATGAIRAAYNRQADKLSLACRVSTMAINFVTITGLSRATPAEYEAQWNGRPLRIVLDMGATLKLLGDVDSAERADVLSQQSDFVAAAAQRLLDMRMEKPSKDHATVMISALDLDPEASTHHRRRRAPPSSITAAGPGSTPPATTGA
jgi:hypothetical protein